MFNSKGHLGFLKTSTGNISVRNSHIFLNTVSFVNCSAVSFTGVSSSGSFGTLSVYGGAFALLHSPQVSEFTDGSLEPPMVLKSTGSNLTVIILNSSFDGCSLLTNSTSVRPGTANGGGGAVYANSVALSNFSVSSSNFSSSSVTVACGATGVPSNSSGGALAVEIQGPNFSVVSISSCSFVNCTARGANISNLAVRGGAVAVSRAASVSVTGSAFINCSIADAFDNQFSNVVVCGGAGMSVVLAQNVSINQCLFDATAGQDASKTSTGLLILAPNSSSSTISMASTSFESSSAALNVQCVSDDGFLYVACPQSGPFLLVTDSIISQLALQFQPDFNATGSSLMLLHQNIRLVSSNARVVCYDAQFAVFKKPSQTSLLYFDYSCSPCPFFQIAPTSSVALLDKLPPSVDACLKFSSSLSCPYGVDVCSTILKVTSGFWTNFTAAGNQLNNTLRCPTGYCGCGSESSCVLYPPLSPNYLPDDALCNANRTGVLCGGCKYNFTQSLDGLTCISNAECANNVGWTWAATVVAYAVYAVYTVLTSLQQDDGLITCVLFYGQMSLFSSYQLAKTSVSADTSSSAVSSWFARVAQFESITSLHSRTCYGPDMGAYAVTAAQLSGPAIVLVLSVVITLALKRAQTFMQQRNINVKVSVTATLSTVTLLLFSSITIIAIKLVTCQTDLNVIFIDGTEPCYDAKWKGLVVVVVALCLFPVLFAAALRWKRLPLKVQTTVCSAYSESKYYWGAVTLAFRLVMSVVYASVREFPSVSALVQSFLCVAMLVILMHIKPYRQSITYYFDVLCYLCLIVQFVLEVLVRATESLGISIDSDNNFSTSLHNSYRASFALRYVHASKMHKIKKAIALHFIHPFTCGTHAARTAGLFRLWLAR